MKIDVIVPSPGESITEVDLAQWYVKEGDWVKKDTELGSIESDKASLTLVAEESGQVSLLLDEGDVVSIGSVACTIDTSVEVPAELSGEPTQDDESLVAPAMLQSESAVAVSEIAPDSIASIKLSPKAQAMMNESDLSIDDLVQGLKRVHARDVQAVLDAGIGIRPISTALSNVSYRVEHREQMSSLRRKLAHRLVSVRQETAMLTTFNEVDMSALKSLRASAQEDFLAQYGVKLGYMSFFAKAVASSISKYPLINAMIEGDEIVRPEYVDISVAVSTDKGLLVPIVRGVENRGIGEIEQEIALLASKAREGRLSIDDMSGGTFTITNGGVFGSLLSTPIINPPQSAILGMHNIVDRPVAVSGKVEIRPMMYIALSYDHRLIDGKESVGFLKSVKDFIENPARLFL